jgi:hypothetical protein
LRDDGEKTLGSLIDLFGPRGFAVLFVILLAVPAIPAPTGGVTHVFEVIAMLVALQLIANRDEIWLPDRWRAWVVASSRDSPSITRLVRIVRRLESMSRPRLTFAFGHPLSNVVFGVLVLGGSLAAFLAPPFTGLDTLPAIGVVLLSLGVLLRDFALVVAGVVVGAAGVALEIVVGRAGYELLGDLI